MALPAAVAGIVALAPVAQGAPAAPMAPAPKVTICHRTSALTNPYVQITVAESSVDGDTGNDRGQGDHFLQHRGDVWTSATTRGEDWGDIIPPVAGHSGLNWNAWGIAIWRNGCRPPAVVDTDADGTPDVVDRDDDNDGVPDTTDPDDNGNGTPDATDPGNPESTDSDRDGTPDVTDPDDDGDGVTDTTDPDDDNDGAPDASDPDDNNNGVPDVLDPDEPGSEDPDGDGVPDAVDPDNDGDGITDTVDRDDDGDGVPDATDPDYQPEGEPPGIPETEPLDPEPAAPAVEDSDEDGTPDVSDRDDDNDGVPDTRDGDVNGDGTPETREQALTDEARPPAQLEAGVLTELFGPEDRTSAGVRPVVIVRCAPVAGATRAVPQGDVGAGGMTRALCDVSRYAGHVLVRVRGGAATIVSVVALAPAAGDHRAMREDFRYLVRP